MTLKILKIHQNLSGGWAPSRLLRSLQLFHTPLTALGAGGWEEEEVRSEKKKREGKGGGK